jgi:hypothetical protein
MKRRYFFMQGKMKGTPFQVVVQDVLTSSQLFDSHLCERFRAGQSRIYSLLILLSRRLKNTKSPRHFFQGSQKGLEVSTRCRCTAPLYIDTFLLVSAAGAGGHNTSVTPTTHHPPVKLSCSVVDFVQNQSNSRHRIVFPPIALSKQ